MMHRRHPRLFAVPAVLFAALALSACSTEPTAAPAADAAAFCASYPPLIEAFMNSPLSGGGEPAVELDSSAIIGEAEKLAAVVTASRDLAPEALQPSFNLVSTALDQIRESGDATGFMDDEMMAETLDVDQWVYDNCGWAQVPVTAEDNAFGGIPATLPAGMTAFRLANNDPQFHVILVVRREPGSTATVEELLAYQGNDVAPGFKLVAATGAAPKSFGVAVGDLTPGEYFAINPIPKAGEEGGESLAAQGMMAEFTVEP